MCQSWKLFDTYILPKKKFGCPSPGVCPKYQATRSNAWVRITYMHLGFQMLWKLKMKTRGRTKEPKGEDNDDARPGILSDKPRYRLVFCRCVINLIRNPRVRLNELRVVVLLRLFRHRIRGRRRRSTTGILPTRRRRSFGREIPIWFFHLETREKERGGGDLVAKTLTLSEDEV